MGIRGKGRIGLPIDRVVHVRPHIELGRKRHHRFHLGQITRILLKSLQRPGVNHSAWREETREADLELYRQRRWKLLERQLLRRALPSQISTMSTESARVATHRPARHGPAPRTRIRLAAQGLLGRIPAETLAERERSGVSRLQG